MQNACDLLLLSPRQAESYRNFSVVATNMHTLLSIMQIDRKVQYEQRGQWNVGVGKTYNDKKHLSNYI